MEKEHQPESLQAVTIKPDYPPSEVYGSEPPPAYHRPQHAAVQVAKIIAVTVVLVSVVLGGFLLASAYVTANASCRQLEQELQLLSETADRLQPLQPEALVQEEPKHTGEPLQSEESTKVVKEIHDNKVEDAPQSDTSVSQDSSDNSDGSAENSNETEEEERNPIQIKLPFDLEEIAGALAEKNQRSKMNCIIEKKRADEIIAHQPKTIRLPFGLNLTTDPRFEHATGERMVIICESGNVQRQALPQEPQEPQEETVMIHPVMIPIPISSYQTHMAQQMRPQAPEMPSQRIHPIEMMRPPMPEPAMSQQAQENQIPPAFIQHIAQQLISRRIQMEAQRAHEEAVRRAQEEAQQNNDVQEVDQRVPIQRLAVPEPMLAQRRIPIPEEVLTQLNRLPNHEVIVSVSEDADEVPQEMRVIQHQRQNAQEMNGRQTYARGIPVHIPVPMMQQETHEQQQAEVAEETRPHYVQPRSVDRAQVN